MKIWPLLLSFLLVATSPIAREISGSQYNSGNWSGAAYTFEETGKWSHCVITGKYRSGYDLSFSLTDSYEVGVFLSHTKIPVFKGVDEFEIRTKVDRFGPMYGKATPINDYTAGIWFKDLDKALKQFKKGRVLEISSRLVDEEFGLAGTFRALDTTYKCASKYQNYQDADVGNSDNNSQSKAAVWTPEATDTAAMYQLATLMISDFGLTDFSFVPEEDKISSGPIEFKARNGSLWGIVSVGREKGDIDLNVVMAEDVATLTAKWCGDGDIAIVNSTFEVEGIRTKSLRGVCDSPTKAFTAFITKQVIAQVLVETVIIDYGQTALSGSYKDNVNENIGFIAAKFIKVN